MKSSIRTMLLAAAALTAFAAPALAESLTCNVTAPEIRLRKSPSKKAPVVAVLKKDAKVTTEGKCAGGWVKVSAGGHTGYVGGWALGAPEAVAASVTADPQSAKAEVVASSGTIESDAPRTEAAAPAPATAQKEIPNNEQLAFQITQLRLNVLGLDRDVQKMKKDIQKIKVVVSRKAQTRKVAANTKGR